MGPFANPKTYGVTQAETKLFSFEELRTFRLANDQISAPFAPQRSPNFSNQTTTLLEKRPDLSLPTQKRFP